MSPPLQAGDGPVTERTAACFMAALHQSVPAFAIQLAASADQAGTGATLDMILTDMVDPQFSDQRARVQDWVTKQQATTPPGTPFGRASAAMPLERWDHHQRLRFAEDEVSKLAEPADAIPAGVR